MAQTVKGKVGNIDITARVQKDMVMLSMISKYGVMRARRMRHDRFLEIRDKVRAGNGSIDVHFCSLPPSNSEDFRNYFIVIGTCFPNKSTARRGIVRFINKVSTVISNNTRPIL